MQIKLNLQIFIFIIVFILTNQIELYVILMIFAFIHELSHTLVGILLGFKPKSLHIMPFGLTILLESNNNKEKIELKKIIIALAGPFSNLLIAIISIFLNVDIRLKEILVYSNFLIMLFNLIPLYPLDGGRVVKGLLKLKYKKEVVDKIINKMSNIMVIIITAITSITIMYFRNIALLFVVIYLWVIIIRENKKYNLKKRVYDIISKKHVDI